MKGRLVIGASVLCFGLLGLSVGILLVSAGGVVGGLTAFIVAAAVAPAHAWRTSLRMAPDAFDFERYGADTEWSTRVAHHVVVSVLGVVTGAVAGAVAGLFASAAVPGLGSALGLFLAGAVSFVVSTALFVRVNDDYRRDGNETAA